MARHHARRHPHCFGIFFDGHLGGAVVYGPEYGENLGVWDRYGFTGKIIALKRGACLHWAHPHAASKLIRRSMDLLPERYEVVTATVDAAAGEIGTIYQACGFHYVGVMSKGGRAHIRRRRHASLSERNARRRFGTGGWKALAALGHRRQARRPARRATSPFGARGEQQKLLPGGHRPPAAALSAPTILGGLATPLRSPLTPVPRSSGPPPPATGGLAG